MKILVTGCNGYIGSHVVERLKQQGHHLTGWDIDFHGESNNVLHYLDSFSYTDVTDVNISGEFDAVVHLAGLSIVPDSIKWPYGYYRTNIQGTETVVNRIKCDHILFASTSSAWEMASPYARSKVAAEDVIRQFSNNYTIFRFFNVSGTNGTFRQLGEATHLIRVAAEVAAGKREYLSIYGTDYPTRDGTCIRDYVHVLDLADAIAESIDRGALNTPYECIGSNIGFSVLEVINTMRKVTNHPIPTKTTGPRSGDAVSSVVDNLSKLITLNRTIEDMCLSQYHLELSK
jgi:UDP-glucose 4-epimerase